MSTWTEGWLPEPIERVTVLMMGLLYHLLPGDVGAWARRFGEIPPRMNNACDSTGTPCRRLPLLPPPLANGDADFLPRVAMIPWLRPHAVPPSPLRS